MPKPTLRRVTSRARLRLTVGVLALLGSTVAAVATTTPADAAPARTVHWAVSRPTCAQPADPATIRCFSDKSVDVPKGTPGAYAYTPGAAPTGAAGGLSPNDLARIYHYNRAASVSQTVAIVDWYDNPYALRDLNHYDAHYGLPTETSRSFRKVNQHGNASPLPVYNSTHDNRIEISLDIEAVRAVCNKCRILLVEASSPSDANLALAENTAVRLGADEVSNSWGGPENHVSSALRSAVRHPGVVITASTGDDGWFGWDWANYPEYASDNWASFPSTSPYVVAVGGTSLSLTSSGARAAEWVWNNNGPGDSLGFPAGTPLGASGGGCSRLETASGWQGHDQQAGFSYATIGCHTHRSATDIAAVADPATGLGMFYSSKSAGHWIRVGGTSLSSPVIAAMYALAGGSGGSAYPAASLYVNHVKHPSTTYDVTLGANGYCGHNRTTHVATTPAACAQSVSDQTGLDTNNPNAIYGAGNDLQDCTFNHEGDYVTAVPSHPQAQCTATAGYDGPTGVGTPTSLSVFHDTSPGATITTAKTIKHRVTTTLRGTIHPVSGAHVAAVSWSFGDGASAHGTAATVHHRYARAGRYTVTMVAEDSLYQRVYRHRTVTVK